MFDLTVAAEAQRELKVRWRCISIALQHVRDENVEVWILIAHAFKSSDIN